MKTNIDDALNVGSNTPVFNNGHSVLLGVGLRSSMSQNLDVYKFQIEYLLMRSS